MTIENVAMHIMLLKTYSVTNFPLRTIVTNMIELKWEYDR